MVKKDVLPQPLVRTVGNTSTDKSLHGPQYQLQEQLVHQTKDVINSSFHQVISSAKIPSNNKAPPSSSYSRKKRNVENTKRFQIARNILDDFIDVQKLPVQDDDNGISNRKLPFYMRYILMIILNTQYAAIFFLKDIFLCSLLLRPNQLNHLKPDLVLAKFRH